METKNYKVKFFGSKERHTQIQRITMNIQARTTGEIEELLRHKHRYVIINSLKIRQIPA